MYLYQAFNLRKQLISIFQRVSRIFREFESTFCLKYFRNIVIVMTKGKNKKIKTTNIYLFFEATPSLSGPPPLNFSHGKNIWNFFHRYMGIWSKGGKIDRMAILAKTQKWYEGESNPEREG